MDTGSLDEKTMILLVARLGPLRRRVDARPPYWRHHLRLRDGPPLSSRTFAQDSRDDFARRANQKFARVGGFGGIAGSLVRFSLIWSHPSALASLRSTTKS